MDSNSTSYNFLQGGGEMGQLIRAKDWSQTPLGHPETWPETLKTMVNVMLDNPFGMYIAWGEDYTQIYNDAYRPILADNKHPQALGTSTKDTFLEIWDIVRPMFDGVMEGTPIGFSDFMLPLNRNGQVEVCYFDFAYSPIRMSNGTVGGVLVTIVETTNKKKAEEALKESKNELEFVIDTAELGTFDYNPITKNFTANNRLKNWFGLPSEERIELSNAIDVIAEEDKERVLEAISDVLQPSSSGSYNIEYSLINPDSGKPIIVHARGRAWFNKAKIAYRLTGTIEDVTNRVLERKRIEESERSLRLMILQAPVAIAIFREPDYQVEIANRLALQLWGRTEEQVLNKPVFETLPELVSQGIKDFVDGVYTTGQRFSTSEMPVKFTKNDEEVLIYISFSFEALYDTDGHINGVMAIGTDVTPQVEARKKVEESEQNMRALVESAPFPIAVFTGDDMRILLANQSVMDAWGKGNDVIGKLYADILPEFGSQHIFDQIRKVLRTGIPFHTKNQRVEIVINGKLNTFYYNYSFTPLLDASGNVYAVMNTAAEVTELNEAKQKVEESEKRFRDMVMQAPLGIVIFSGKENVIEMANDNYLQLIEKTEAQFVGKPLFEVLPEVEDVMSPIITDLYKTGRPFYGYEFPIKLDRHGTTETGYYNFVYHPLKENNNIIGVMVVASEVTAMVKTKHLIEENEEKLKLIIEASELGVYDANLKSGEINASERCYEILGFPEKAQLSHKDIITTLHPEDHIVRKKAFKKAFAEGTLHYQARVIWKDQSLHWIDAKGKVFYDDNNEPLRLLGTVRDITEERSFQQQLLEREEKFRLLADSMPQHVWTSDPDGNLNYFNQSVYDYSGLTPEQIIKDGWIQIVHPDDWEENMKQWNDAISTGNDFLIEHRFKKYNGEYRWQLSRAIPQKDADGHIKMWVGSSTDIQEQKMFTTELENMVQLRTNELEKKNLDLEKINKELQSFVYISSHDLQEPLRKIQTFSSRIFETEYDILSDRAKKHFNRMQKSAYRMQNLIQDLISYSRTNVQESNFESVDLSEVIEELKETLSEELEEHQVTIKLNNICAIEVIPVQFKQIMHNLISNSIKFAKAELPVVIEINCEKVEAKSLDIALPSDHAHFYHISYTDNGIGFEPEYNQKIFEVFQRLHSKDEYSGTGIGLAIVKRIIENHEGIIHANGKLNQGAKFDIYLPTESRAVEY
ncbi:PAS domain-containing sensor histidine kinase [Gelidibacter maritimus]|uniref:histidine kinase n=1 Tax=Gelidibacter maritimus TaxID=2761487 RepID=A0A7W2R2Q9_9FLAO|nr:PAS domain S-box protein [Gelidibacter maritimus]MBA6152037.1 PAS domain S-box protein [Gelidibacter maritimus]